MKRGSSKQEKDRPLHDPRALNMLHQRAERRAIRAVEQEALKAAAAKDREALRAAARGERHVS